MNRTLALALVALPAIRAAIDAVETVIDLADRFGLSDLVASREVRGWELDAELSVHRFGLGVLVDHEPARTAIDGEFTTVGLLVGPVRLSAFRARPAAVLLDRRLSEPDGCVEPGCTNPRSHRHEPIAVTPPVEAAEMRRTLGERLVGPSAWEALERGEHLAPQPDPRRAL